MYTRTHPYDQRDTGRDRHREAKTETCIDTDTQTHRQRITIDVKKSTNL